MFVGSYKYIYIYIYTCIIKWSYPIMIVLVTSIYKQKMYLIITLEMLAIHPLPGRHRLVSDPGLQAPEPLVLRAVLGSQLVHGWIWYPVTPIGAGGSWKSPQGDGMGDVSHLIQGSVNHPILLGDQIINFMELYGHLDEFPFKNTVDGNEKSGKFTSWGWYLKSHYLQRVLGTSQVVGLGISEPWTVGFL